MNLRKPIMNALMVTAGSVVATIAIVSQAEDPLPAFATIDKNGDGAISPSEAMGTWLASAFARVDSNGDGFVTKSEYEAAS